LVVALSVLAVLLHSGLGALQASLDRWAVLASREEAVGLIGLARSRAIGTTGASVTFDELGGTVRIESAWPDTVVRPMERHGVGVEIVGASTRYVLRFDPLGLGRVGSRRLRFTRGSASATLVVSSYGRVRRQ